jgi:thiamine biosynthesis lipoprotein
VTRRAVASWRDWSCTVRVVVDDGRRLDAAREIVASIMAEVERAASRFRADSELSRCNARAGRLTPVSELFLELLDVALSAARSTSGAVDPTVGGDLIALGYDVDIEQVRTRGPEPFAVQTPVPRRATPRWRSVGVNHALGLALVPPGVELDLGATAKAWTADRAAQLLGEVLGSAALVEIGGDIAVAGAPVEPFAVRVAEREGDPGEIVDLRHGGLTTSTTVVRRWPIGRNEAHHIVDPRTGRPADGPWRSATVWAPTAVAANMSSTAAIVLGDGAEDWLDDHAPVSRLVAADGAVRRLSGWPDLAAAA